MFRFTQILMGVLVVAFLFMLRPQELGGTAAYITVDQPGLEPTLFVGDLAILKQQKEYKVGELVAVETQHGPYFGRVLGQKDEVYQVRLGTSITPTDVQPEFLLGRLWFNIGDFGRMVGASILEQFGLAAEAAP